MVESIEEPRPMNADQTPAALHSQVSGSSFYAGMRVLPPARREAMYAVYGVCRAVDDIADDHEGNREVRRIALQAWRDDIDNLYAGRDPGSAALVARAVKEFDLDAADFHAVIDGMAMDIDADICAPDAATLDLYCDRVASAVGRLSVKIFGMEREPGLTLAHHLGRALQLTNILRDIDEDAAIGRAYLPREHLLAAGVNIETPAHIAMDEHVDAACRDVAALAHVHFAAANKILATRPKGHLIAPRLMAAVYSKILRRMEAASWRGPRHRIKVGKAELIWTVVRVGLLG
jgi:phytoene synthase